VLADVLADPGRFAEPVGPDVLDGTFTHLESTAREAVAVGGWTEAEPLRLAKRAVGWLVRCPRRALAADGNGATGLIDERMIGLIVDAAAKLATLGPRRPVTAASAVAYLAASGETSVAEHLDAVGTTAADRLMADASGRVDRLVAGWPSIEPAWWPRVEDPVQVRLADGAVTVAGRLDIALGGPPTGRPAVVVEVKSGRWHDDMRADAHLYALLVSLRDGEAPAAVVTIVPDGTTHIEPIRPALVVHAGERLELAMRTAAGLAAGEVAEPRPGSYCGHCPVRPQCEPGQSWVAQHDAAREP
jgi:hypothetical protein